MEVKVCLVLKSNSTAEESTCRETWVWFVDYCVCVWEAKEEVEEVLILVFGGGVFGGRVGGFNKKWEGGGRWWKSSNQPLMCGVGCEWIQFRFVRKEWWRKRGVRIGKEANSTVNRTGEVEERGLKLELKAGSCCSWNRPHQTRQEDYSSQKN